MMPVVYAMTFCINYEEFKFVFSLLFYVFVVEQLKVPYACLHRRNIENPRQGIMCEHAHTCSAVHDVIIDTVSCDGLVRSNMYSIHIDMQEQLYYSV
jgi:hypothetical protein